MITRKTKRKLSIGVLLIVIIIIGYSSYWFISSFGLAVNLLQEDDPSTKQISEEYKSLFATSAYTKLRVEHTYNSKVRSPITLIDYDSIYSILIYKISMNSKAGLSKILFLEYKDADQSPNIAYRGIPYSFMFKYKAGKESSATQLFLTINGDSIRSLFHSDTLVNYAATFEDLSISYTKDGIKEIYAVSDDAFIKTKIPINVLFLKRGMTIYLFFLSVKVHGKSIPDSLLYNLITGIEKQIR
ncbi:hypothetical protein [Taibaiella koreensis]|uniref:hypothetical protein n=1 Tax=Taibaiella koreensis TaxID=1268548 RepID=UPI000E59D003|nr:hypothetical protein [Taibaiella koreensis]